MKTDKILITGTGRCGTTFLMKLFTLLEFDTGFSKDTYEDHIFKNCNSGLELEYFDKSYISKSPIYIIRMDIIMNDPEVEVKYVLVPIRDLRECAESRYRYGNSSGGLWNATTVEEQISFYEKILKEYKEAEIKFNIPTIYIDFNDMISNPQYLYDILLPILNEKNINFDTFNEAYKEASKTSKNIKV